MKVNKKLSKHHFSDLKKAELIVDRQIFLLYNFLEDLIGSDLPEDLERKIRDLYFYVDEKYFSFCNCDLGYEITDNYLVYTFEYKEYLD